MEKKYELTNETIEIDGRILHRIKALKSFANVEKGELGGFIESERNLSQEGKCWVYDNAKVYHNAYIYENAKVFGNAVIKNNAHVFGDAIIQNGVNILDAVKIGEKALIKGNIVICEKVRIYGKTEIKGDITLCGNALLKSDKDYIVFKNWWDNGNYFTWTRSNNMWNIGCFYGTGEELIKRAYQDGERNGREYERIVKYVESILKEKH